jgi:hypothetical protein
MDELEQLKYMAGLGGNNQGKLVEYKGPDTPTRTGGSNPSITAAEKINYQHEHNVQPGTQEWFRLWFSKPYLTGESPF